MTDASKRELIELSHELGVESRRLAMLGEGNTSSRISEQSFAVKASGSSLGTLGQADVTECRFEPLIHLLDAAEASDETVERVLGESRVDPASKKPSTEAFFHAFLLTLPEINFVGHTHPVSVNQVLCSPRAEEFATSRLFPDEIVCCGPASVYVPYVDPGIQLARTIREKTRQFIAERNRTPKVILLGNHGLIALGRSAAAVRATTLMADKAAAIFSGAATMGGPRFLSEQNIQRIDTRLDEAYRQRMLKL